MQNVQLGNTFSTRALCALAILAAAPSLYGQCSSVSVSTVTINPGTIANYPSAPQILFTGCGTLPFSAITATGLPSGVNVDWYFMSSSQTGVYLYGSTSASGSYTVSVYRNSTLLGSFTLVVNLSISPSSLSAITVGQTVSQQISVSGGTAPFTFSISAGNLPGGLSLSPSGTISGTVNAAGTSNFTITVNDSASATNSLSYSWTSNAAPSITTTSLVSGTAGVGYSQIVSASGGTGSLSWTVLSGSLPTNLSLVGGTISGTPSTVGSFTFTVKATDTNGVFATQQLTISIATSLTAISPTSFATGTVGQSISSTFTATGGTGSNQWTVSVGALPGGLNLATNGALTGTLNAAGTFSFTVQVTDSSTGFITRAYSWTVNAAPSITTTSLPNGTATVAYSQQLAATGGTGTLAWSLLTGTPPSPISLGSTGLLSGTVASATSSTFTVQVTDSNNISATQQLTLTIQPNTVQITVTTVPTGLSVTAGAQTGTSPLTVTATVGSSLAISTTDPQAGTTGTRYVFSAWQHGGSMSQSVTVPSQATTYTANFTTQYLLTTAVSPANSAVVSPSPSSVSGYYDSGTQITLTSTPNTGYQFYNWTGAPGGTSAQNPLVFTLSAPATVTANAYVLLTFQSSPTGPQYKIDTVARSGSFQVAKLPGDTVQLDANAPQAGPSAGVRYAFLNWSDTGTAAHSITAGTTPATYTVTYTYDYLLTTALTPQRGSITANPPSVDGYYRTGTAVSLTANADASYRFLTWIDGVKDNPRSVTMDAPKSFTAQLEPIPCDFTFSPSAVSVLPSGDLGSVQVRTGSHCPWTASTEASWLIVSSQYTDGDPSSGTVSFQAAANPSSSARSAVVRVGERSFMVYQSSSTCTFNLTPANLTAPASQSSFTMQVTTPSGCAWTPVAMTSWVQVQGNGEARTNSGSVPLTIQTNMDPLPRASAVSAGGLMMPILQRSAQMPQLFGDIPPSHPFFDYIYFTSVRQVTQGCAGGNFCPDTPINRAEMARIIIRALFGESFTASSTPYFTDVPATDLDFRYIQKLREMGVTTGCGNNNYCPNATTSRGEMAVFLTRARLRINSSVTPPYTLTPFFTDVPATNGFFPYIQKVREFGITVGCSATTYCPTDIVTRAQMAAFVARGLFY